MQNTNTTSPLTEGEHFASVNGITIHYHVKGKGPVLLLPSPGWGPSVDYIMPLPGVEKHFTMVYYDARLSGQSTGPDDPSRYSVQDFVDDMEGLRIHLKQPKVFIAGHSGGGHQVLEYGIQYSDRLLGIVAIDAIAATDAIRGEEMARRIAKKKEEPFYLANPSYYENAAAFMLGKDRTPRPLKEIIKIIGGFYFYDPAMGEKALGHLEYSDKVFGYSMASGFQGKNLLPDLHKITVPTLVIVGDDDFICDPITQGARIHENIASSKLVLIKNAGHFPWIEQPEQFASECEAWIKELNFQIRRSS